MRSTLSILENETVSRLTTFLHKKPQMADDYAARCWNSDGSWVVFRIADKKPLLTVIGISVVIVNIVFNVLTKIHLNFVMGRGLCWNCKKLNSRV